MDRSGKKLASRSISEYKMNLLYSFCKLDERVQKLDEPEMTETSIEDFINKIRKLYSETVIDCFSECILLKMY